MEKVLSHLRKIEDKYCEEDATVDSELNNIIISLSSSGVSVSSTVTLLHVIFMKIIGEAGGKDGKADSQGKNMIALHFI
jgi:hypothetical protein